MEGLEVAFVNLDVLYSEIHVLYSEIHELEVREVDLTKSNGELLQACKVSGREG